MTYRTEGTVARARGVTQQHMTPIDPPVLPSRIPTLTTCPARLDHSPSKPKAMGYIREDLAGRHLERCTREIMSEGRSLGYRVPYVVRLWPQMVPDLVQHVLGVARGLEVSALIVPDLAHVDNQPGPICDYMDLITISPQQTWARIYEPEAERPHYPLDAIVLPESFLQPFLVPLPEGHSDPGGRMDCPAAHRIMQEHRECRAVNCPRKAAALTILVDAGVMVPATSSLARRAAQRGMTGEPALEPWHLQTMHIGPSATADSAPTPAQ